MPGPGLVREGRDTEGNEFGLRQNDPAAPGLSY
jgi:hypothetical protein